MPLFYFHLCDRTGETCSEGVDLHDLEEARMEAVKGAREIIAEDVRQGRLDLSGRIEVRDACDSFVLVVRFDSVVCTGECNHRAELLLADQRIAQGRKRIAEQETRIERLRDMHRDVSAAEDRLAQFRALLIEWERHLNALTASIGGWRPAP